MNDSRGVSAEASVKLDARVGEVIDGRYEIVRPLGRGAMGAVYEVAHKNLEQRFALKILTAAVPEPSLHARFEREARTASSLQHPNIVHVFDLGTLPDGCPYLVMELLRGKPLSHELEQLDALELPRVVRLLSGVASALDLAHARGVLHRDIKPDNLFLVQREDGTELVKVVDFGLAALVLPTARRITRRGMWVGTPHYMAPESTREELPDHRADVYSLGVVAYELLSGRCPFEEGDLLALIGRKLSEDAPPLSTAARPFSSAVDAALARCLARDPAVRPASAGAFVRALAEAAGLEAPRLSPIPELRQGARSGARRVLLVDDDADFRAIIAPQLRAVGIEVDEVGTSAAAEARIARGGIDLLVIDGLLPDGTGLELVERLRASGARQPVVFVSAYWRGAAAQTLLRSGLGVGAVLHKPLPPEALTEVVCDELVKVATADRVLELVGDEPDRAIGLVHAVEPITQVRAAQTAPGHESPSLAAMRAAYAQTLREQLRDLEARVSGLRGSSDLQVAAQEARMLAHRICGTAGTYGYSAVSSICRELEDWLEALCRPRALPSVGALVHASELARAALEAVGDLPRVGSEGSTRGHLATVAFLGPSAATYRDLLRRVGIAVVGAVDVGGVATLLRRTSFDGVVIEGTVADCVAKLHALRADGPRIPAVFLVPEVSQSEVLVGLYAGADAVVPRTATGPELVDLARRAAMRRRHAMPTIVVLDDDEHFTRAVADVLERAEARVVRLHHPSWLLQTLEEQKPELLLLDVEMPGVTGLELCRLLRASARWSDLPVLFMTAHTDEETRTRCFWAGGDDYLSKPIVHAELLARVKVRLDRARLHREAIERDAISGLLNRRGLISRFDAVLVDCRRRGTSLAMAVLALDGLAELNASGGDARGDEAIATIGTLLAERLPPETLRARTRGGEFVVAVPDVPRASADEFVARMRGEAHGHRLRLRGGTALLPTEATDLDGGLELARSRSRA